MTLADLLPRWSVLARAIAFVALLNAVALLGYRVPWVAAASFAVTVACVAGLALWRYETAVLVVIGELAISAKGYLFAIPVGSFTLSLRYALFALLVLGWLWRAVRRRNDALLRSPFVWSLLTLAAVLAMGLWRGFAAAAPWRIVYADANGYVALLFIPLFLGVLTQRRVLVRALRWLFLGVVSSGCIALLISATFSFVYFSPSLVSATQVDASQRQQLDQRALTPDAADLSQTVLLTPDRLRYRAGETTEQKPLLYRWLRDSGQAEVAYLGHRVFRVFSANLWFALPLALLLASLTLRERARRQRWVGFAWTCALAAIVIGSLSRSLWLGLGAAALAFLSTLHRTEWRRAAAGLGIAALLGALVVVAVPAVRTTLGERLVGVARPGSDIAALNRVSLVHAIADRWHDAPLLGSGFGARVTYPVAVAGTDLVEYVQVYLFEWTYLDVLIKVGAVGLAAFLLFLGQLVQRQVVAWRRARDDDAGLARALLAGTIGFLALNVTTPYLNHPLGLAYLAIAIGADAYLTTRRLPWRG